MGNLPTGLPLHEAQKSEAQERDGRGNAGMPGVDPRKMGRLRQYIETEGSPFAPTIWYNLSIMVEFKTTNYFVGFWFVGGKGQDWFACVYREQGQTNWHLVHRFRYHDDASTDPFDAKDKKSYHDASVDGNAKDENQIIEDVNKLAAVIGMRFEAKPEFVTVNGDGDRALFRLAMQSWAHVKREKMPGAEAET